MKPARIIFPLLCLLFSLTVSAQGLPYVNHWYYGQNAGLNFNGGIPNVISGGQISTTEGVSSASDQVTGALLFYTDGIRVWNRNHVTMTNGTGLSGGSSASQSALVVPDPGNANEYYIFTVSSNSATGMRWSKVDMSLSAGLGAVTLKNNFLFSPSTERQTAVKHGNGIDTWVMGQTTNGGFRSFRVTTTGIVAGPTSTIGASSADNIGQMKFSPNGMNLAWVDHGNGSAHLFDFNDQTGVVSNYGLMASGFTKAAGCSFSPDNSKLYASLGNNYKQIHQWDLCQTGRAAQAASRTYIGTFSGGWGGFMNLARDGRIYYSHYNSLFLGVISNPNALGVACNYNENGLNLNGQRCYLGVPTFVESVFLQAPGGSTAGCTVLGAELTALSAEATGKGLVLVSWQGVEDTDLKHYEVQRRKANGFETIGREQANGQAGVPANYVVPDPEAHAGWNFYRLKMVDMDGEITYSYVVEAFLEKVESGWLAFPMPAQGSFTLLRSQSNVSVETDLRLVNALGQVVWQEKAVAEDVLRVQVDVSSLAAGVYTLQSQAGTVLHVQQIIVQ